MSLKRVCKRSVSCSHSLRCQCEYEIYYSPVLINHILYVMNYRKMVKFFTKLVYLDDAIKMLNADAYLLISWLVASSPFQAAAM